MVYMLSRIEDIKLDKYLAENIITGEKFLAIAKGNIRKSIKIKVGDIVKIIKEDNNYIIISVLPRINDFIRPPVVNIDYMYITISVKSPVPDLLLLDKQLIVAISKNVTPIIVINKIDLEKENSKKIKISKTINDIYTKLGYKVLEVSAKDKINIEKIKDIEKNKMVVFSGSSGSGKSSIIKTLVTETISDNIEIGKVSKKLERGRHTTKYVRLYEIHNIKGEKIYLLDTPGFSSYEIFDIKSEDIKKYYKEFQKIECSYKDCNHINEDIKECKVKQEVKEGNIDTGRYERYITIYNDIKLKEKNKYK